MVRGIALLAASALVLGGCATVDMTQLGNAPDSSQSSGPVDIIERATDRLFALFTSKGLSTHQSRQRMQSAASVLLEGMDEKALTAVAYAPATPEALQTDLAEARLHVDQTVRAAEVFLAMSAPRDDLRDELAALEQALLASRQAELAFAKHVDDTDAMGGFTTTVDRLRDVTDELGRRVRRAGTRSAAVVAATSL